MKSTTYAVLRFVQVIQSWIAKNCLFFKQFSHPVLNGDKLSPFPWSEQFTLGTKVGAPHLILTLAGEDQPMPVKLCLAEDVHVVL